MTLYSPNGSYPAALPHRIRLSDGSTRTDASTFTADEIADAGYVAAPTIPTYDPETHTLGWDGADWTLTTIPDPVPADFPLTARQIRLGLIRHNVPLATVQAAIDAIGDDAQRDEAQVYWEFSTQVNWEHPMTQALMALSGITPTDAEIMWLAAKDYTD